MVRRSTTDPAVASSIEAIFRLLEGQLLVGSAYDLCAWWESEGGGQRLGGMVGYSAMLDLLNRKAVTPSICQPGWTLQYRPNLPLPHWHPNRL